jgi:hypothetical protein
LNQYAAAQAALIPGLGDLDLSSFGRNLSKATHWNTSQFRGAPKPLLAGIRAANQAAPPTNADPVKPSPPSAATRVSGFRMQEMSRNQVNPGKAAPPISTSISVLLMVLLGLGAAVEWNGRPRRKQ